MELSRHDGATFIDCTKTVLEYTSGDDWRIKANSNTTYSNAGLVNNTAGKVIANYWLDQVYTPEEGKAHREGDYHIHDLDCLTPYCFTGDTKVVLLDGTTPSFKELTDRYKNGEYFWVLSRDKQGNIVPGKAHHPRLVKRNAELIEITISGGAKIICTPDHEFMLRDGSYKQAKDLRSRESLMPYYSSKQGSGYTFVRDAKLGIAEYLHRLVGSWKSGIKDLAGYAVHHINGDKKDNRPENIEVLCDKEHRALELRNTMQSSVWQKANNNRLQEYNRSEEKRSAISKLAQQRKRNEKGQFYNHTVVSKKYLDYAEDVYCLTVDEHENFALAAGVFVHNCAGWNLRSLLNEGFNGVRSRVNSRPPHHFREALGQMANFLGILQSEWAGAQAFSSFDTFLAPYVFRDKMSFKSVKKAIRGFVYNLNVPSRWGQCVNSSYKCLRGDGKWVSHNDLKVGDSIYVVDVKTGALKKDTVTHVNVFSAPEKMHRYSNEQEFSFDVTPNHRVIYKTGSNPFAIKESSELIPKKGPVYIPVSSWNAQTPESFMGNEYDIDDELLEFITFIMCDGCIVSQEGRSPRLEFYKSTSRYGCDRFEELCSILNIDYSVSEDKSAKFEGSYCNKYRLKNSEVVSQVISMLDGDKHKCPKFMSFLSPRQAYIVLDTWVMLDGNFDGSHWKMQADTREIQEMLAFLTVIAGKTASLKECVIGDNKTATSYTNIYKRGCRACTIEEVNPKESTVWCPTTNTGTFVCMTDDGYIFLTGNSPFTNVTIDWTVPDDLKDSAPISGGFHLLEGISDPELLEKAVERGVEALEEMTYKHFQPEMNMIQKAYYEVMTEGDSTGQPFTFPIPTVNITEEFDWEGENVMTLFENTAKIGSSYFQNFIGSQYKIDENGNKVEDEEAYKPSAVRSMAFTPTQEFVYKDNEGRVTRSTLSKIYEAWEANMSTAKGCKYEFMFNGKFYPITEMFKIDYSEYDRTKTIVLDNGYSFGVSVDHKCLVYDPVKKKTYNKLSQDIVSGDLIPVASKKWDTPSTHGSYEAGRVIGYYLAEGWSDDCRVYFAININRKDIVNDIKTLFESLGIEVVVDKQDAVNIYKVTAHGSGAVAYVHQFVTGKTAKQKRLYRYTWNTSTAFRQGLFDGYVETDGCGKDSNVVAHTTNKDLCDDLICLASSLGIVLKFRVNKNNTRYFKADKSDKVTFTSYKLYRFASTPKDGVHYIPVREVKDVMHIPQFVYNFTIGNDDHLVELSNGIISPQCCRLQLDLNELRKRGNGLFGSAESTGSIGVVTINLARLGYRFKGDKRGLYKELDRLMVMAKSTLEKKRAIVAELFEKGLYPYTKRYLPGGYRNHFSTIGVNGGNEMIRNFTNGKHDITSKWGAKFAEDLLNYIRKRMKDFQNETGNLYNLEASPGEGATHRFAREDAKRYPDIIQAGCKETGKIYYTNSTQLPSWYTDDLFMALKLQDTLQTRYTGGTVFHMYMSEMVSSPEACRDIVRKILTNFKMPYITVTPLFSVCEKHGYLKGRHDYCPICDDEIIQEARSKCNC